MFDADPAVSPAVLPPVLTCREYAALVRMRPDYVATLCATKKVPGAVKVHGSWRIPRSALPQVCTPVPPPEDAADHARRAVGAADQLAAM